MTTIDAATIDEDVLDEEAKRPAAKKIPLVEGPFGPTIQGEGSVIGQQTYFLRFGLCDYKCVMCDSLHAVLPKVVRANAEWLTQEEIFNKFCDYAAENTTRWVTYSGGNPAMHNLSELTFNLQSNGFRINVETQGTLWQDYLGSVDSLTISPKGPGMGEVTHIDVLDRFMDLTYKARINSVCMKIVVFDQRDLDFAAEMFHRYAEEQGLLDYDQCYLSLGNPLPPNPGEDDSKTFTESDVVTWKLDLLNTYRILFEDIRNHPILSRVKFLPQWHVFVWGNGQGH